MKAARRARQIGCTALQVFSDNPTAWRRRPQPPADAAGFVEFCRREGIGPIAVHASYLLNLAGSEEPFASQSREGLLHEMQRAPAYGASLVNVHVGSHRGDGGTAGLHRVAVAVRSILPESPAGVRLVLENSAGGGDSVGATIEELAELLIATGDIGQRLAFCLDTAHLWGAGYDMATAEGALAVLDRFSELIGLERLALIHLNDSKSARASRTDRHEHLGAGQLGPAGLAAVLRDPRLRGTTFIMETPGMDEGYDAVNLRRARLLYAGSMPLPRLPPGAFRLDRRSTRRFSRSRGGPTVDPASRTADEPVPGRASG